MHQPTPAGNGYCPTNLLPQ